jgi:hypothetical protein
VNEEVRAFNRKPSQIAQKFGTASLVSAEHQRYLFPAMDYM